ncbi:MAG TPA: polyphenol oxidase family protein [Chloroflexota bacterium]|nr:polyphenol oxidase family protein [Chloroflexota bacterium]
MNPPDAPAFAASPHPSALRFPLLDAHVDHVTHAIFTRRGGVSAPPLDSLNVSYSVGDNLEAVAENRARCAAALGLTSSVIVSAGLIHKAAVARVEHAVLQPLPDGSRLVEDVDGLITAKPGIGLLITAADCLQVLLYDPEIPAIGIAHAGWRGLAAGVVSATVAAMTLAFGSRPAHMLAGIGPGLGPCCAQFTDPTHELPSWFAPYIHGRHVDLWAAARAQLADAGLERPHIEQHALCTVCNRDQFFSHRGDHGRTGRFAAIIALH